MSKIDHTSHVRAFGFAKTTWPVWTTGLILLIISFQESWLKQFGCSTIGGKEVCTLLYELAFEKGVAFDLSLFLIGIPLLSATFLSRIRSAIFDVFSDAIKQSSSVSDLLRSQLRSGALSRGQIKALMQESFLYFDGSSKLSRGEFGKFVIEILENYEKEKTNPYRSGLNATFIVHEPTEDGGNLPYDESIWFETHALAGEFYPLDATATLEATRAELEQLFYNWDFKIELDSFSFDLKSHSRHVLIDDLACGALVQLDGATLVYEQEKLTIHVNAVVPITTDNPRQIRTESGLMSSGEREYTTALRYPTKGVNITVQVPPRFVVKAQSFTPIQLQWPAAKQTVGAGGTHVRQSYDGWLLPGLCSVIMWERRHSADLATPPEAHSGMQQTVSVKRSIWSFWRDGQ